MITSPFLTLAFGIVLDIPWLVMVLVRLGIVHPNQLAQHRKIVIIVCVVLAAMFTPPDPWSQLAFFIPMVLLFELGLFISRFMVPKRSLMSRIQGGGDGEDKEKAE